MGMVEPPWKRFGAVKIVPDKVKMIKTELIGTEYGEDWVVLEFEGRIC